NLEFLDAVEYLAEKHGIEYEKKEPTAEEREARFRQEQLLIVNKAAQDFFSSRMEAPAAVEYCKKRDWDKDLIDVFHIGFAPGANQLLKTLTKAGYKKEILLKAGLIKQNQDNGDYYDTFRNRIVFPITDKSGRILGFSGRDITGKNDTPKYLNTAETEIFTKGKQLFGYYQAYREIANTETVFLVEGNPDVVRMYEVGAENTVAPLGTALTDDQVKELAKKARTFVLVGDNDKSGVEAVIDHGKKIIQMGLSCRIMPIIEGKDPDEYFSIRKGEFKEYYRNEVQDFIPWLTSRLMDGKRSQSEIMPVITEITGLMAYCRDENIVKMYLEQFTRQYKNGSIWRSEYNKAKNTIERMAAKEKGTMDMVANFNFFVRNNCYFGVGANGGDKIWSNFIFKPILHVKDEKNARRIFLMVNNLGQEVVIKLKQSELVSFTDFKTRVESAGNFIWEAGQPELQQLKKYLYSETDSADEIKQLGWQKRFGFFAWGNGGMDAGIFEKANKFGVVTIQDRKYYIPGNALDTIDNTQGYQLMRRFVYAETSSITLNEFAAKLIGVFGDNAKVGLCFLLATLFKDIVTSVTTSFPILNLFGPKGTGKSEMGHALVSFFMPNYEAPNINSSTKAALAEVVAEVSNAIVHLDEYKNNLDLDKREFLKGIWDGTGRSRINLDNDKKRETTAVDSGVIMSGQEMPTADIAL
ncbi:MAG: toprim domain-containing protein, partial [Bacteroidales bacterium]|nr:toprim domain-containing protein [Bacteroidales bacterium]